MLNFQTVEFETSCGLVSQIGLSDRPEIVFTGRSNVGKSSLINRICNKKSMARTSSVPGKTETINFYAAPSFRLVDLPGYGYAKRAKSRKADWGDLMEAYFRSAREIRLAIALVDARIGLTADDLLMLDYLEAYGIEFIIAATKADKLNKTELSELPQKFPGKYRGRVMAVSSLNAMGTEALKEAVSSVIERGV